MSKNSKAQVVWITGASSGLGKALVSEFFSQGYRIILSGRNKDTLHKVVAEFNIPSSHYLIIPLDLSAPQSLLNLSREVINHFGQIDILIHNGGISQRSSFSEMSFEVMEKIINTNLLGAIALTKSVLPIFQEQNYGQIIVISSIQGKVPLPYRTGYSASKHALHGFFESLRLECPFLKVLMVCPGYIKTNLSKNALIGNGESQGKIDKNQAKGLHPNHIAKKIFLATRSNKRIIFPAGIKEKTALFLQYWSPKLLEHFL